MSFTLLSHPKRREAKVQRSIYLTTAASHRSRRWSQVLDLQEEPTTRRQTDLRVDVWLVNRIQFSAHGAAQRGSPIFQLSLQHLELPKFSSARVSMFIL